MPTAAERRAARRAEIARRLREADEPAGTVEDTTETFTEERPQPETVEETTVTSEPIRKRKVGLPDQATSQRSRKPPNYKLHVLTALSLAVAIRFARYGTKAITG